MECFVFVPDTKKCDPEMNVFVLYAKCDRILEMTVFLDYNGNNCEEVCIL